MKLIFITIILALSFAACTPAGGIKPSKFSYPPNYLKSFSLNTITEEQLLNMVGTPDRQMQTDSKKRFTFKANAAGNMTYTYIIENGIVTDVIYNENGSLNGITAKGEQAK